MSFVPTPEEIKKQIDGVVRYLVEVGLAGDQNFAFRRELAGGCIEVTFPQAVHVIRDRLRGSFTR